MYARIFLDPKFRFDKPKTLYFQRNHVSLKHPCTKQQPQSLLIASTHTMAACLVTVSYRIMATKLMSTMDLIPIPPDRMGTLTIKS
jgi:hypothetical protein